MSTRARLSQDRSRQRRDQLLDAAIELFAINGTRGITHRAVAARAGLPPATTTYYFTSIDELIDQALARHMETWLRDLDQLIQIPVNAKLDVDNVGDLLAAVFAARSVETVSLQLSVFLTAAQHEALQPRAAQALDALDTLAAELFSGLGIAEPEKLAQSIVAIVGGSAMSWLTGRRSDADEAAALSCSILGLITAALMTKEEHREIAKRLNPPAADAS